MHRLFVLAVLVPWMASAAPLAINGIEFQTPKIEVTPLSEMPSTVPVQVGERIQVIVHTISEAALSVTSGLSVYAYPTLNNFRFNFFNVEPWTNHGVTALPWKVEAEEGGYRATLGLEFESNPRWNQIQVGYLIVQNEHGERVEMPYSPQSPIFIVE